MPDEVLTDKAAILSRMAESQRALRAALDSAGPDLLERPATWGEGTLKDLLAHLVYWQTLAAERVQLFIDGRADEALALSPSDEADTDARNANVLTANQARPLGEITDAFESSYRTVRTATKSVPPALFTDESLPVRTWIAGNTYEHYEEHTKDIEHAIQRQSN